MSGDRRDNLTVPKPGEVRNPKGNNQYTQTRKFLDHVEKTITQEDRDELLVTLIDNAKKGQSWAMNLLMSRLWPEVSKLAITDSDGNDPPKTFNLKELRERLVSAIVSGELGALESSLLSDDLGTDGGPSDEGV